MLYNAMMWICKGNSLLESWIWSDKIKITPNVYVGHTDGHFEL